MVRQHRSVEINDDVNASVNAGKVTARARRLLAGAAGACLLAGASLTLAPSATAGVIPSCADQSFGPNFFEDYCSVEDGETVYFIVRSAGGGKGGDSYDGQLGGFGGLGYQVTGSYTNSTGGAVTLNVTVGFPGVDGLDGSGPGDPDGQDGAPGNLAALSVDGGALSSSSVPGRVA